MSRVVSAGPLAFDRLDTGAEEGRDKSPPLEPCGPAGLRILLRPVRMARDLSTDPIHRLCTVTTSELWELVYERDERRCVVPRLDPDAPRCTNRWGDPIKQTPGRAYPRESLTFAHIKMAPGGPRVDDERHGVMVCWGHHVFGNMYVTSKHGLEKVRGYLRDRYGWDYD